MVERVEAYPWVTVTLDKKNNRGTVGYNMIVLKKEIADYKPYQYKEEDRFIFDAILTHIPSRIQYHTLTMEKVKDFLIGEDVIVEPRNILGELEKFFD
ncbi:hypothetical protein ABZZ08_002892 [Listeria monocytogenes]